MNSLAGSRMSVMYRSLLPSHHGHEARGKKLVKAFCKHWRVPRAHTELALITTEFHTLVHRALELKPSTTGKLEGLHRYLTASRSHALEGGFQVT